LMGLTYDMLFSIIHLITYNPEYTDCIKIYYIKNFGITNP
jgi:hypothetical protein